MLRYAFWTRETNMTSRVDPVDRISEICDDAEGDKLTRIAAVLGFDEKPVVAPEEERPYLIRLRHAAETKAGDVWIKRKTPLHYAEVVGRAGHRTVLLKHWNGRKTSKFESYLASEYYLRRLPS